MSETSPARAQVVAISGAGTGIGQVTAQKFAELGWAVVIGGRRGELLEETSASIVQSGGNCVAHRLDVTDAASVDEFFAHAEDELGIVTAVINNAATARYGPMDEFSPEEIEVEIATKLIGSLYMARRGIRGMRAAGSGGDLLFVTSSAGAQPWPFHLPYAAANAGVEHAARTLRLELEGSGIRVTLLRCGETMGTDFATRELESGRMADANDLWFRRGLLRHVGLMTPDMVADAIVHAVTLPESHQLDVIAVSPKAPPGELPRTYDEWTEAMLRQFTGD